MILVGYDGDEMKQPEWANDGSFLAFRDLQQLVPEFDKYVHALSSLSGSELLTYLLLGTWRRRLARFHSLKTLQIRRKNSQRISWEGGGMVRFIILNRVPRDF
jgi:hypothetical protein